MFALDVAAIRERANADGAFRRSARFWSARVGFELGSNCFELRVKDGRVEDFARVPGLEGSFDFRISGPAQAWEKLLAPVPPPGYQDLRFGGSGGVGFKIRGDLIEKVAPHYAALQDFLDVVRRSRGAPTAAPTEPDVERRFDSAVGRYLYLRLDGVQYRVYFEEAGSGIPMLLQHTAGADGRQWRHVLEDPDYQRNFRMIAYDLPFHGKSVPPTGVRWWEQEYRLTREFLMNFVVALSHALELERPVYMGCSIGGHLAPDLALHHPDEFRAVIGINAGLATPAGDAATQQSFDHPRVGSEWKGAVMRGCMAPTSPEALQRETSWVYNQGGPPVLQGDVHYYSFDHDLTVEQARRIDTSKLDVYLLTGEYDALAAENGTPELARNIAGAYYRMIPGMGHFGPAENPQDFKRALLPVLEKIAAKR